MIISTFLNQDTVIEAAAKGDDLIRIVKDSIREEDSGIRFVVDNQYYYCAMIIHDSSLNWSIKKNAIQKLVKGHCAFGSPNTYVTLQDIVQYANKPTLVNLLRKDITL